jgi:hypothetical protein
MGLMVTGAGAGCSSMKPPVAAPVVVHNETVQRETPAELPGVPLTEDRDGVPSGLTTGFLVLEGLTAEQLASIRVIAEEGSVLLVPSNGTISGVDGLWRRGERRWFKVPGGTRVSVRPVGAASSQAGGTTVTSLTADGLSYQITASPASTLYQQLKGPAAAAGWQEDAGLSAHPTDYPF